MLAIYIETVRQLEDALSRLERLRPPPALIDDPTYPRYRHQVKSIGTAIFLKTVRIISALNASLVLLGKGYVQEANILFRAIDESLDDIVFLPDCPQMGTPQNISCDFCKNFIKRNLNLERPRSLQSRAEIA